jgi:hypothetical protein
MKKFALWMLFASTALASQATGWMSAREIERLSLTIALAEYPIRERDAKDLLGLPTFMPPVIGGGGVHKAEYLISALSNPDDPKGFYAIRFRFAKLPVPPSEYIARSGMTEAHEEPERTIATIDLLFWSVSPDLTFKVERREPPEMIEMMRAHMKEKKLSPLEFSREATTSRPTAQNDRPNQALEPTTTAVTNRAGARFAPAAVVAHL